jgi:hypothetical protein
MSTAARDPRVGASSAGLRAGFWAKREAVKYKNSETKRAERERTGSRE